MNILKINLMRDSRAVYPDSDILGIDGENKQTYLEFCFIDKFVDGEALLEVQRDNEKYYIILEKNIDKYVLEVKNSLVNKEGSIKFQLRVFNNDNVVFKSQIFELNVLEAINSTEKIPDEYTTWIEDANQKLKEISDYADERKEEMSAIADGVKDMATAIQFATFEVNDNMELLINQADKLANTIFNVNDNGYLEVKIA